MDSQETVAVVEFEHAKVFLVSEDGSAPKLKYPNSVKIKAEYDPEVSLNTRWPDKFKMKSFQVKSQSR